MALRGGWLSDPVQGWDGPADLYLADGRVAAVQPAGAPPPPGAWEERDCTGLLVLPGPIDTFCHLGREGDPWAEDPWTLALAAAAGGWTAVVAYTGSADPAAVARWRSLDLPVRLYPVAAATDGARLAEMGLLRAAGAVAVSDPPDRLRDARLMRRVLEYAGGSGLPVVVRPEDPDLARGGVMHEGARSFALGLRGIPAAAEEVAVCRDLALQRAFGGRLHFAALSSAGALRRLQDACGAAGAEGAAAADAGAGAPGAARTAASAPAPGTADPVGNGAAAPPPARPTATGAPADRERHPGRGRPGEAGAAAALRAGVGGPAGPGASDRGDGAGEAPGRREAAADGAWRSPGTATGRGSDDAALPAPGTGVTAGVTAEHLLLTDADVRPWDASTKLAPPLRGEADRRALLWALRQGWLMLASGHRPCPPERKACEYDYAEFGASALETALAVGLELLRPAALARACSSAPAAAFGLPGGTLCPGAPADLAVFDPRAEWVVEPHALRSAGRSTPLAGRRMRGRAVLTVVGGRLAFDAGRQGVGHRCISMQERLP